MGEKGGCRRIKKKEPVCLDCPHTKDARDVEGEMGRDLWEKRAGEMGGRNGREKWAEWV